MKIRTALLLAGLAASFAGCVVTHRAAPPHDHDYHDYHSTPSYEGYYYVRIIFIHSIPYYVDDYRYIRPIPPHLHDHFRRYPYGKLGHSPVFSRDSEVRDGYPMSRIIYFNGIPYHVEDNRYAQPLPERLHQRFRYTPNQVIAPANGNRPHNSGRQDNGREHESPAYGRDRDERGQNGQERRRMEQPPFERSSRESNAPAEPEFRSPALPERRGAPSRQEQPGADEADNHNANGRGRSRNDERPQADNGHRQDNGKKTHRGKDDEQEGNGRGNGNRGD